MRGRYGVHPTELVQQQYELDRKKGVRFSDNINVKSDTADTATKADKADKVDIEHKPPAAPVNSQVPVVNPSQQAPSVSSNNSSQIKSHSRQPDSQDTFPSRGSRHVVRGDSPARAKRESGGLSPVSQHLCAPYLRCSLCCAVLESRWVSMLVLFSE